MSTDREKLLRSIGFSVPTNAFIEPAFTHSSFVNEHPREQSYERLEFLGDAVLSLVSSQYLFTAYPDFPEGILTDIRAALVRTEKLAEISRRLGVGSYIRLSKGEHLNKGFESENILADVLEALIGALYLQEALPAVQAFFLSYFVPHIAPIIEKKSYRDPKTMFQEMIQQQLKITPTYEVIRQDKENGEFIVAVMVNKKRIATGNGKTKKAAESAAAATAIGNLRDNVL